MSAYLKHVLARAGITHVNRATVLSHGEEWARHDVAEELQSAFPECAIQPGCDSLSLPGDLIAIVYARSFVSEFGAHLDELRGVARRRSKAVCLLYGLKDRQISIVPAPRILREYSHRKRSLVAVDALQRFGLLPLAVRAMSCLVRHR